MHNMVVTKFLCFGDPSLQKHLKKKPAVSANHPYPVLSSPLLSCPILSYPISYLILI